MTPTVGSKGAGVDWHKGRETPAGVFAVLEKNFDHHSTLYDDASMPHMQRITWNGISDAWRPIAGVCRLARLRADAIRLCAEAVRQDADRDARDHFPERRNSRRVFSRSAAGAECGGRRCCSGACRDARVARQTRPPKRPTRLKKSATTAAREAASSKVTLRKLEGPSPRPTRAVSLTPKRQLAAAKTDQAKARAEEQKLKAAAKAAEAATKLDTAKAELRRRLMPQPKQQMPPRRPRPERPTPAKAATDAKLALEPVSIYISRATQKLYVRRNTHKPWPDGGEVFDATIEVPVTIRDPDKPIGTHVFTAMARNDAGLRWTAVTIDTGDDAKNALDRISIPKDVLDRIAPTALPRSSIIVSDEPLSRETNYRTEFVAVLSNQPQGGFITRRPTVSDFPQFGQPWNSGGGFFSFFDQPGPYPQPGNSRRRRGSNQPGWW